MRSYMYCHPTHYIPHPFHMNTLVRMYRNPIGSCHCIYKNYGLTLRRGLTIVYAHFESCYN